MATHPSGRSAWLLPLVGVVAFVTGLQKHYVLDPVTRWLRDLPNAAAIAVACAAIAAVVGSMARREQARRRQVRAAAETIAEKARPG